MIRRLIILLLIVGCGSRLNTNPNEIQIITSDIDRFWSTVDNYEGDLSNALDKEYIKQGTNGLKDFIPKRIISAEALAEHYLDNKEYYNSIRESTLQVEKAKDEIVNILYEFKEIYPKAKFPNIYYIIGRMNSGGTAKNSGLLIGAEMFKNYEESIVTVIHELIHYQQPNILSFRVSLLTQSLREGCADFITSLLIDEEARMQPDTYKYGYIHEKKLWEEFYAVMNSKDSDEQYIWLYGGQAEDRPMMLGYFIGNQIA
ncbi:uncharacterized protein METZ01_LOCUS439545, partial [marine metagenome]